MSVCWCHQNCSVPSVWQALVGSDLQPIDATAAAEADKRGLAGPVFSICFTMPWSPSHVVQRLHALGAPKAPSRFHLVSQFPTLITCCHCPGLFPTMSPTHTHGLSSKVLAFAALLLLWNTSVDWTGEVRVSQT